jgi:hypothetical protein
MEFASGSGFLGAVRIARPAASYLTGLVVPVDGGGLRSL